MPTSKTTDHDRVEGRNPVLEALRGPRKVRAVYIAGGVERRGPIAEILSMCADGRIPVREVSREQLAEMAETASPQGVIADVSPFRYASVDEILKSDNLHTPLVFALDGVEDPRNFGSLLRVADATGADGVIVAKRRSAHITPTVAKASAGAVEYVKVAQVANIAGTIEKLKEEGLWVVGADSRSKTEYFELDLSGPLLLVLGGEGKGLGRLVASRCDFLARLSMTGKVESLNVATAGAVLAYEALRQRAARNE